MICIIFEVWSHNPVGSQTSINYHAGAAGAAGAAATADGGVDSG